MKMRRKSLNAALLALLAGGALATGGCDAAKKLLEELQKQNATGPRKLSDEDAFRHLARDRSAAPETDVASIVSVIDDQAAAAGGQKQAGVVSDPAKAKMLKSVALARRTIQVKKFDKTMDKFIPDMKSGPKADCDNGPIDVASLEDELLIRNIEKIPVRDQKYRGTCAAFTGIGAIEYAALNGVKQNIGANPNLPTLDLSEQRFYWQSKIECQAPSDCKISQSGEGSWYGTGFDASVEASSDGATTNIPFEQDCAYASMPGESPNDSDTQNPQPDACSKGAVAVRKVDSWCGIKQIIKFLQDGYAVPYASPLTSNWESNDGLITAADMAPGESGHAGGHAFLIVGYKKLPPSVPESEGGLCFVIKNSWGTGWGAGGYSCMTVGWMKKVGFEGFFDYPQPVPVEVLLAQELQATEELPPDEGTAEDATIDEFGEDEEVPVDGEEAAIPAIPPDIDPNGDVLPIDEEVVPDEGTGGETGAGGDTGAGGAAVPDGNTDIPGTDVPEPPMDKFSAAKLLGPNRAYYKVLVAKEGKELRIKGLIKGGGETKQVRVNLTGNKLIFKGDAVGEYDSAKGILTLCTEDFSPLCSLRYRKAAKLMYIQFRDDDLRTVQPAETSAEAGAWQDVSFSGQKYGLFVPTDALSLEFIANPKTFVRMNEGEASRLGLRSQKAAGGFGFNVLLSGLQVGEIPFDALGNSSFCSGKYSKTCGLVGDGKVGVVPSNLRNRGL